MSEQAGKYEVEENDTLGLEMVGAGYDVRVKDEANDHKYFTITPRIVKAYARNAHDLALWETVKDIAGEAGECYLNSSQLSVLAGISMGQVYDSRRYWMKIGFLKGELKKDEGYSQKVWHLSVPDLWAKNIEWCEKYPKIADRIVFRKAHKAFHRVKANESLSPSESSLSPSETKKNLSKKNNNGDKSPKLSDMPIEWQIAGNVEEVVVPDDTQAKRKDAANLIAVGFGTSSSAAFDLVMAFQNERNITFTESDIKGQRKAVKALLEKKAKPDHIQEAVKKLTQNQMTFVDLFGIIKTVTDLVNQPEKVLETVHRVMPTFDESGRRINA
jgi:hypothetical protein